MERRLRYAAILIIITSLTMFVVVDMNYVFFWEIPSHDFEWAISVGDEFELNCSAYGYISYPPHQAESISLSVLVNTSIIVRIVNIPSINITSETDFLNLVSINKVSTRFTNGSSIPSNIASTLNSLISKFIMPVGGWEYLDFLFPDSLSDVGQEEYSSDTYLSQLDDESLMFGYRYYYIDAGHWWNGNVFVSNGLPTCIETASSSYHPGYVQYNWTFRLDFVSN
ncbi:MAG: hypothetical protein ACFFEV_09175 [Candidatus Thorarchaeota archaeon]